jgi:hypothetical protein
MLVTNRLRQLQRIIEKYYEKNEIFNSIESTDSLSDEIKIKFYKNLFSSLDPKSQIIDSKYFVRSLKLYKRYCIFFPKREHIKI